MSHPESTPSQVRPITGHDSSGSWIPIRRLNNRHRPDVLRHLLALSPDDRYLRFEHIAADEQVQRYVDQLDFERDEIFGVFNRRLELVAMAHLAFDGGTEGLPADTAEFGVSVATHLRGRGVGQRLFAHAALHARNRGVHTLVVHALSENAPMLRIARSAGAAIERSGGEARARVKLAPDTLATRVGALVDEGVAGVDYGIKRQVQRVDRLVSAIAGSYT